MCVCECVCVCVCVRVCVCVCIVSSLEQPQPILMRHPNPNLWNVLRNLSEIEYVYGIYKGRKSGYNALCKKWLYFEGLYC